MAVLDATTLLHFLEPDARAAMDPASGEPIPDAKARIEGLVAELQKAKETILVPTPVLSEVLVHADEAGPGYLQILHRTARLRIVPFGERAAVELAAMTREALRRAIFAPGRQRRARSSSSTDRSLQSPVLKARRPSTRMTAM